MPAGTPPDDVSLKRALGKWMLSHKDDPDMSAKTVRRALETQFGCKLTTKKDSLKAWCMEMYTDLHTPRPEMLRTIFGGDAEEDEPKTRTRLHPGESGLNAYLEQHPDLRPAPPPKKKDDDEDRKVERAACMGDLHALRQCILQQERKRSTTPTLDDELIRLRRKVGDHVELTVRFQHIQNLEWAVDAATMPDGPRAWHAQARRDLGPLLTPDARDFMVFLRQGPMDHDMVRKTYMRPAVRAPDGRADLEPHAQRENAKRTKHNDKILFILRALADFTPATTTVVHHNTETPHPVDAHARALGQATTPDDQQTHFRAIRDALHAWEQICAAPHHVIATTGTVLRRACRAPHTHPQTRQDIRRLLLQWHAYAEDTHNQQTHPEHARAVFRKQELPAPRGRTTTTTTKATWRLKKTQTVQLAQETHRTPKTLAIQHLMLRIGPHGPWKPWTQQIPPMVTTQNEQKQKQKHRRKRTPTTARLPLIPTRRHKRTRHTPEEEGEIQE